MTDFEKFCLAFCLVVGIILTAGFSVKIGQKIGYNKGYEAALNEPHKADTVWRDTTIYVDNPVEVVKWKDKLVYVPITDSVIINHHDTTYIALQFESKIYADSTYRAQVSGFEPTLDWIQVHQKTAYITNTIVKRQHWGASITGGPAVLYNGKVHAGIGVAIGLSYNF